MSSKTEARAWWIPAGLTLLALAVRLPGLNGGLWADEIYSTVYAFRTPLPQALFEFHGDNKHPFYALLAHGSLSMFGESPWALRLPALLFGVATVPLLYALGRRITTRREAGFAAAILAVSYHHTWFSQSARGYTILACLAIASTWLLLRVLRDGDVKAGVAFAVCIAVGAYTHLTFVFAVLAQFVVVALSMAGWPNGRRTDWRLGLGIFVGGGALALLLYAPMFSKVVSFFLHKESALKGVSSPAWALGEALRALQVGLGGSGTLLGAGLVALGVGAAVGLWGLVSYVRSDRQVAALLVLPAFTMLAGALASRGTMYPRFFFLLAGFVLLIAVRGVHATAGWFAARFGRPALGGALAALPLGLVIVASVASLPRDWRLPKQDYEGAMRFVDERSGAEDAVGTADMTTEIYGHFFGRQWHDVRDVPDLEALRKDRKVWLVYTFPRYLARYDARLAELVARECRPERVFPGSVGGGDVIVCTLSATGT